MSPAVVCRFTVLSVTSFALMTGHQKTFAVEERLVQRCVRKKFEIARSRKTGEGHQPIL